MTARRARGLVSGAVMMLIVAGCGAPPPDPVEIRIPTAAEPATVCMTAVVRGTLVADDRWGVALRRRGAHPVVKLIFPFGYRAFAESDGRIAIVDRGERVVAHAGDVISTAGGFGAHDEEATICGL